MEQVPAVPLLVVRHGGQSASVRPGELLGMRTDGARAEKPPGKCPGCGDEAARVQYVLCKSAHAILRTAEAQSSLNSNARVWAVSPDKWRWSPLFSTRAQSPVQRTNTFKRRAAAE